MNKKVVGFYGYMQVMDANYHKTSSALINLEVNQGYNIGLVSDSSLTIYLYVALDMYHSAWLTL